ncbi:MerR family transcriptional regulator [Hymenobacter aerophilus]|uniref:DNA-binding protein n=1 Tax=Hymenobacter aerophilus TaxID=119644 RepID=UPI0003793EC2|nr:DNA-binding protein [Hymenobacter aerophilus]
MQTVVLIPEPEWRQIVHRLDQLEQAARATAPAAEPAGQFLNVRQAAAHLGMKPDGLRKARRAGRIQGVRLNEKEWGFRPAELTRYQNRYNRYPATTERQAA